MPADAPETRSIGWGTLKSAAIEARRTLILARERYGRGRSKPRLTGKDLDLYAVAIMRTASFPPTMKNGLLQLPRLLAGSGRG